MILKKNFALNTMFLDNYQEVKGSIAIQACSETDQWEHCLLTAHSAVFPVNPSLLYMLSEISKTD